MITILNTETLGVTEYSLSYTGIVAHEGALYGAASGLFGPADGFAAGSIKTGRLIPLDAQEYNIPLALVVSKGTGTTTLTSTMERLGVEESESGTAVGKAALGQYEVPLSRSKECRSYRFEVALAAGQELWELNVSIDPVRVRKA